MISPDKIPLRDGNIDKNELISLFYEQERIKPSPLMFNGGLGLFGLFFVLAMSSVAYVLFCQKHLIGSFVFGSVALALFWLTTRILGFLTHYQSGLDYLKGHPEAFQLQTGTLIKKAPVGFDPTMSKRTPFVWRTENGLQGKCARPFSEKVEAGREVWVAVPTGDRGQAVALAAK